MITLFWYQFWIKIKWGKKTFFSLKSFFIGWIFFHPNIYSFGILNVFYENADFRDQYGNFSSKTKCKTKRCMAGLKPVAYSSKWALLLFELLLPFFFGISPYLIQVKFWDSNFRIFFSDFERGKNKISSLIEPLELPVKGINSIFSKKIFFQFFGLKFWGLFYTLIILIENRQIGIKYLFFLN